MVRRRQFECALLVFIIALLAGGAALAQSGNGYDLSWWTVDGGGHTVSSGGDYTLGGTIGQPDASTLTGGGYTLAAGFWAGGGVVAGYDVYLPLVVHGP
jgi:hypothetical protein